MQLKASSMLFIMLLIFISVLGCSQQVIVSDKVIRDTEVIDTVDVYIDVGEGVMFSIQIKDPAQVRKVISLLEGVEIKEFSATQGKKLFASAEAWSQEVDYQITLLATSEFDSTDPSAAIKGGLIMLNDGNLIFLNPETLIHSPGPLSEADSEAIYFYISTEKQPEIIARLVEIIEDNKANGGI